MAMCTNIYVNDVPAHNEASIAVILTCYSLQPIVETFQNLNKMLFSVTESLRYLLHKLIL